MSSAARSIDRQAAKRRDQLQPFLERVLAWVMENYEPPQEALNPDASRLGGIPCSPFGGADNYIDYLLHQSPMTRLLTNY